MKPEFAHDGISYSVTVSTLNGEYYATWTCLKCKVTGGPTHSCHRADDAIACAKARAFSDHHFDRHVVVPASAIRRVARSS
jgi:hypothetical protein